MRDDDEDDDDDDNDEARPMHGVRAESEQWHRQLAGR